MRHPEDAPIRGWLRVYRPVWWSLAGAVGTLGTAGAWLELGAGGAVVLLAGLAALGVLGTWQFGPQRGDGRPGLHAVVLGSACALGFLAVIGLGYELGPVGLAGGALVAAAGWPLQRRRSCVAAPDRSQAVPAPPPDPPVEYVQEPPLPGLPELHDLSTPRLCWAWRASYACLHRYPWPSYQDHLAELRRECLGELERRDPVAFGRWLPTARAASDPARYFCRQSQR